MKNHVKLGVLVLVLLVIALALVFTQPSQDAGAPAGDTHQHEGEGENVEGENRSQEKPTQPAQAQTARPQVHNAFGPYLPAAKGPRTRVELGTSMGKIEILLYDDLAPRTAKNFLDLVNKAYYTNMIFHRVVKGFVIQTGDPTGTGRGGPGYYIDDEIVPELSHNQPGVVAMANAGPNTSSSQFYITTGPVTRLDAGYSIFGQVTKGMDVVQAINGVMTDPNGRPLSPVRFNSVTVLGQE